MKTLPAKRLKNSIKFGDRFQLGEHFLLCGDSLNKEMVKDFLKNRKIKAVISDIPYGVDVNQSKAWCGQKLSCPKDIINDHLQTDEEYKEFNQKWLQNIIPFLEKKNSLYIFNSDKMIFPLREAMVDSGLKFSQLLIWIKNHAVIGRLDYLPMHELIAYGWYGTHEFRKAKDKSVLFYPKPNRSKAHPSMKPIGLLRNLILNSTNLDDTVWDGFLGSGSLIIAAEQTHRKCLGIEIDPDYCLTTIQRWEALTGLKAKKIS
ncbi:MAG: DNA methyltransferase [Candidatus Uhrbacteria bacterium]